MKINEAAHDEGVGGGVELKIKWIYRVKRGRVDPLQRISPYIFYALN